MALRIAYCLAGPPSQPHTNLQSRSRFGLAPTIGLRPVARKNAPFTLTRGTHGSAEPDPLLAVEFGVSRQRISQILQSSGWTVAPLPSRPCPPSYQCLCGRLQRSPDLCKDCDVVELRCRHCQLPVRRTVPYMLHLFRFNKTTNVYCDRSV